MQASASAAEVRFQEIFTRLTAEGMPENAAAAQALLACANVAEAGAADAAAPAAAPAASTDDASMGADE